MKFGFTPEAEILNARAAMIGFVAAVGAYPPLVKSSLVYSDVGPSSIDDWRIILWSVLLLTLLTTKTMVLVAA